MPSDISPEMLFDKRIAERNLRKGLITQKDHDVRLKALADSADRATVVEAKVEQTATTAGMSAASRAQEEEERD